MTMAQMRSAEKLSEHRMTRWHNPTKHTQRVIISDGEGRSLQRFAFIVEPGETKELDSRYDRAIHIVDCGQDECHKRGRFCTKGHEGLIMGGGAPMLQRVGHKDELDPVLDPELAEQKQLREQMAAAATMGAVGQNIAATTAVKLEEMDRPKPAAPAQSKK